MTVKNMHAQTYENEVILKSFIREGNLKCKAKTNYLCNLILLAAVVNFCQTIYSNLSVYKASCVPLAE